MQERCTEHYRSRTVWHYPFHFNVIKNYITNHKLLLTSVFVTETCCKQSIGLINRTINARYRLIGFRRSADQYHNLQILLPMILNWWLASKILIKASLLASPDNFMIASPSSLVWKARQQTNGMNQMNKSQLKNLHQRFSTVIQPGHQTGCVLCI